MDWPMVRDLMTSPIITIPAHLRLPSIKGLLRERQIGRVPVVENGRLVGIISLGDVRNAYPSDASMLSMHAPTHLVERVTAADVMRASVVTIEASAPIAEAIRLMLQHHIGGVPVVESGHLVGMITAGDVCRAVLVGTLKPDPPVVAAP